MKLRKSKKPYKFVEVDGEWVGITKEAYFKFIKEQSDGWSERDPESHAKASKN